MGTYENVFFQVLFKSFAVRTCYNKQFQAKVFFVKGPFSLVYFLRFFNLSFIKTSPDLLDLEILKMLDFHENPRFFHENQVFSKNSCVGHLYRQKTVSLCFLEYFKYIHHRVYLNFACWKFCFKFEQIHGFSRFFLIGFLKKNIRKF